MGLAFAVMNWRFGCASDPSACVLLLALHSHRSHQYLPDKTLAHKTPNPAAPHLEEKHLTNTDPHANLRAHSLLPGGTSIRSIAHLQTSPCQWKSSQQAAFGLRHRQPQGCQWPPGSWGWRRTWRIPTPGPSQRVVVLSATTVPRLWSTGEVEVPSHEAAKHVWFPRASSLPGFPSRPVFWAKVPRRCHRRKDRRRLESGLKRSQPCDLRVFHGHCHQQFTSPTFCHPKLASGVSRLSAWFLWWVEVPISRCWGGEMTTISWRRGDDSHQAAKFWWLKVWEMPLTQREMPSLCVVCHKNPCVGPDVG